MKTLFAAVKVKGIIGLLCLFSLAMPAFANVVISEIMYHPPQLIDDDYEFLELYNNDSSTINLQNWSFDGITFTFGPDASIAPGAFLLLARNPSKVQEAYGFLPSYTYTGKLSNSGESIKLLDANGVVVDEVAYSTYPPWPVTPDEEGPSLERIDLTLNGNTPRNWHASVAAAGHTAGALNSVNAVGLPPWITNVQHGTVQQDIPITVTAFVEDATTVNLKYIINFGTPVVIAMLDDGLSGDGAASDGVCGATIPAQPMNTLIRYRIDTTGPTGSMGLPRDDDSVTYTGTFIEDDASVITGLPILHWFMDPADYDDALAHYNTDDTEPALLYYDGILYDGVQIRVRGATSRSYPKKNWKFYPPRNHDFFAPGLTEIPVDNFNLQASYTDKSYMREYLSYHLFEDVGHPTSQFFPVRLYQNGQFYGLYMYFEHPEKNYLTRNNLDADSGTTYEATPGDQSDCRYFAIDQLPDWYEKHRPDDGDFNDLHDFLNGINNLTGQARRNFIFDNVDIPRMLNYWAAIILMHENDSVAKNYYLYRDTAGTKRWSMLPWDKDLTWGRNWQGQVLNDEIWADVDTVYGRTNVTPSHPLFGDQTHLKYDYWWNRFIDALLNESDIREMYFRRLRTVMDEQLQPPGTAYEQLKLEKKIDAMAALLDTEAAMNYAEWGSWGQIQTIDQAAQILKDDYLAVRRTHLFVTHRVAGEIPEAQTPGLPIIINEIMYNPAGGSDDEFVELYNPSSTESVDMSGWRFDGVALTFPPGTVLLPQSYSVVVRNDVQFRVTYGSGIFIAAQYEGGLDNGGENLVLKDSQGNVIDEVCYDDGGFWPDSPDGDGPSLELIDISQSNNRPTNWAASDSAGGTPGTLNSMAGTSPSIPDLMVNEVLSLNGSINTDEQDEYEPWIEIYNASPDSVDLGGMFLTDDYDNPTKWQIPADTVLNSGEWMIFWADAEPNDGPLHTNFSLNVDGGSVGLYTAAGDIIDYLDYDSLPTDVSYGKYPDGIATCREFAIPTPAAENYIEPVPVILNEYNAVSGSKYLKDNGTDTFWGRIEGNGGDWFELVVIQDHLDMRGWQLVVSDDTGGEDESIETLTLTSDDIWSDLRSGTIITVSEDLPDDLSNYDPQSGKWWINVQANDDGSGTYITASNFKVSNDNWQLTIRDSNGVDIFGPAGEGIKPDSGIGSDEVFKLEEDPGPHITERANYNDGTSSTFGSANIYADGTIVQDFSELRDIPDTGAPTPDPATWAIVPTMTGGTSITMIAATASDPAGVEYYFNNVTDPTHDSSWQSSSYYKDKGLAPETQYTYRVKARDKSINQNETDWSTAESAKTGSAWIVLTYDDFEDGWGSYTDGGSDCSLYNGGSYAHQGSSAADIQDNSGTSSSFYYTNPVDIHTAGYVQLEIDFWFYAVSMESGEDFRVQYYDGSTWHTVASYANGTDFDNGQPYHKTIYIDESSYTFPTNMSIRFMCDASTDYDDVYIDEVKVSGKLGVPDTAPPTPNPMTWASVPTATGSSSIVMTAATADDDTLPVEYYFECTNYGGASSSWQASPTYEATGLDPITQYTFRVKAHDSAPAQNETSWSATASATTEAPSMDIEIIGSWVEGTAHAKESGTNRALIFIAHAEHSSLITLNSVTYGGQAMTKVIERTSGGTSYQAYVVAFILNEAGVNAATSSTFSPSWSTTPSNILYGSVFLSNVHQTTSIGATAGNGTTSSTPNPITTATLSTSDGDMVIDAAACGNTGDYTLLNGFTKALEHDMSSSTGVDGYKSATGTDETPSAQHTNANRQSIIGFVVKAAPPPVPPAQAANPSPANGATDVSLTHDLSWTAGSGATSHDVYFGTTNPPPFSGNQTGTTFDTGTMNATTTYYWRIDEKNTYGTTTGEVWSFITAPPPPAQAADPSPANSATNVSIDTDLSWTAGSGATSHDVYFGTTNPPPFVDNQTGTTFDPGTLNTATTYYWRIDEKNAGGTTTGAVWSFTTVLPPPPGQATNPSPANGATDIDTTTDLSWTAGSGATSHDVYFGTSNPPPFIGNQTSTTFDTGTMSSNTTYYWRIDEKNAGGTTQGTVWSFTTVALVVLLQDGFETNFNNWTDGGTTDWGRTTSQRYSGSYSAYAGAWDNDLISDNLNTTGKSSIRIEFWYRDDDIDDSDNVYLQLYNGSTYVNRFELGNSAEDTWHKCDITIYNGGDDAQYFRSDFRIKFEGSSIDWGENLWIDEVTITAQ